MCLFFPSEMVVRNLIITCTRRLYKVENCIFVNVRGFMSLSRALKSCHFFSSWQVCLWLDFKCQHKMSTSSCRAPDDTSFRIIPFSFLRVHRGLEQVWNQHFELLFRTLPNVWYFGPIQKTPTGWSVFKDMAKVRFSCQVRRHSDFCSDHRFSCSYIFLPLRLTSDVIFEPNINPFSNTLAVLSWLDQHVWPRGVLLPLGRLPEPRPRPLHLDRPEVQPVWAQRLRDSHVVPGGGAEGKSFAYTFLQ